MNELQRAFQDEKKAIQIPETHRTAESRCIQVLEQGSFPTI